MTPPPLAVFDAEIRAAQLAGLSAARVQELVTAREMAREMAERLHRLSPAVAGMVLDTFPRKPVKPG